MTIIAFHTQVMVLLLGQGLSMDIEPAKHSPLGEEHRRAIKQIEAMRGNVDYQPDSQSLIVESIVCRGPRFTDADLSLFAPFRSHPPCGRVAFIETRVTEKGIASVIDQFARVKSLLVMRMPVGDAAFAKLAQLGELEDLELMQTNVTSGIGAHIGRLRKLEMLAISESAIGDEALEHWSGLSKLTWLSLDNTRVTSAGLKSIAKLTALETLGLHGTDVGDEGLVYLKVLPSLKVLRLDGTRVTDGRADAPA